MLDFSDVDPQQSGDLIPDGSFAKVAMTIRPGGVDGQTEIDRGLLKASTILGSDVLSLDCEFTATEGRLARRKFWQNQTVSGGKVDEKGVSIGWNITKRTIRAMIDSALGLDPEDNSEEAKAKRRLRGLADLNGIIFVAKIAVEPSTDPAIRTEQARPAGAAEREGMARRDERRGRAAEPVPLPLGRRGAANTAAAQPAWGQQAAGMPQRAAAVAWQQPATDHAAGVAQRPATDPPPRAQPPSPPARLG